MSLERLTENIEFLDNKVALERSYVLMQNLKRKLNIQMDDPSDHATFFILFMQQNPEIMLDLKPSTPGGLIIDNISIIEHRLQSKYPVMARRLMSQNSKVRFDVFDKQSFQQVQNDPIILDDKDSSA